MKFLLVLLCTASLLHAQHSLTGKIFCGYQGWFATPQDSSKLGWKHYGFSNENACAIDLWPDMSEAAPAERYATPLRYDDGTAAHVFSSTHALTIDRHFLWMKQYGINGVFLQRFGTELKSPRTKAHFDQVLTHVRRAAEKHGRTFCLMYDLSGLKPGEIESVVMQDWKRWKKSDLTKSPAYQQHNGKPIVAVWGIGFNDDRAYTLEECAQLLRFLRDNPEFGGQTTMAGIPWAWRTLNRDAIADAALHDVLTTSADILSPWSVGRYNAKSINQIPAMHEADAAWCKQRKKTYLPVIFPGFSWANMQHQRGKNAELNQIPRNAGAFYWNQIHLRLTAGANTLYVAMFDEMDEATAIFKFSHRVPNSAKGFINEKTVPPDHYLWLTGEAAKAMRKEIPLTEKSPTR